MNSFVERFAQLNKLKKATYSTVAAEIGVSLRALKYYVSGEREPNMSTLISLADYFDVSLDYLVGRSDDPARR